MTYIHWLWHKITLSKKKGKGEEGKKEITKQDSQLFSEKEEFYCIHILKK